MKLKELQGKEYRDADKIIQFLTDPSDQSIDLSDELKKKYLLLKEVHGYRLRFKSKKRIIQLIQMTHSVTERQAYNIINETEYVFGNVSGIEKDYERLFLLDVARRNIALAFKRQDTKAINSAIITYHMVAGLDKDDSNMPDFSKLEQHIYNLTIPPQQAKLLEKMLLSGTVDLARIIPNDAIDITSKNESSGS